MIGVKVRSHVDSRKVVRASREGTVKSLGKAGAYLRGVARKSIKVSPEPAPPGRQPHSRKGRLKNAILFAVEKARQSVVIGPAATAVGRIGHTHEFGGTEPAKKRKGRKPNWKLEVGGHGPISVEGGKAVVVKLLVDNDPATNPDWTAVCAAVAAGIGLIAARDNSKSSESVGAK